MLCNVLVLLHSLKNAMHCGDKYGEIRTLAVLVFRTFGAKNFREGGTAIAREESGSYDP
jgi:hypothetical protein